ncbi:MAG: hypothetical protein JWO84_29 [Parcubacteria group bacterium]|nr:hypothetical protein [Parcubacteria group bacterium]
MTYDRIATGKVTSLSVNGYAVRELFFQPTGPDGDNHKGFLRQLSGHDRDYLRTSGLQRGDQVFNWRSWTGLSKEELEEVEALLDARIPQGCLLENMMVEGIPNFSKLHPTTRLVFPHRDQPELFDERKTVGQAILAVWEENGPCKTVGKRLEDHHGIEGLMSRFVEAAKGKRGVMGFVLSPGLVQVGDTVLVYSPVGVENVLNRQHERELA